MKKPSRTYQPKVIRMWPDVSRRRFLGHAAALAAAGTFFSHRPGMAKATRPGPTVEVIVDFGTPIKNVASMSGLLHGMDTTRPPDEAVQPLRPNLWRVGAYRDWRTIYARLVGFGARLEFVLSDPFGYRSPWPYENFARWEAYVRGQAQLAKGLNVLWDVWNEPNAARFWQGTHEQFFETYRRAYEVLRDELGPDAWIGGPSLSGYNRDFVATFLDSCLANACEVNFLTWHELQSTGARIYPIADHLADARASFVDNPDYAALNIQQIHINEIVGSADQYRPGEIWGAFYYLEQGRADGACKACWPGFDGYDNCANFTLDGLITPNTYQRRSCWWAYKLYADGVDTRVASAASDRLIAPLASARAAKENQAQLLLGYFESPGAAPNVTIQVELGHLFALPFLAFADEMLVRLALIPDSGEAELSAPLVVGEQVVPIDKKGTALMTLPALSLHESSVLFIEAVNKKNGLGTVGTFQ
jgi:hypothetical protein